jgi:hypothetical protein
MGEMKMTTIPLTFAASLRPTQVEAPPPRPSLLKNKLIPNAWRLLDKMTPLVFARYLVTFFVGVFATVAWQSWSAPAATAPPGYQQLNAILLDSVRQRIDRIATHVVSIEELMTRSVDQLGAGQEQLVASHEQMTRDIAKLQAAVSRSTEPPASRNTEPSPRLAPGPVPGAIHRASQAPTEADARSSDWRRQPCCQWPVSSSR